MLLDPVNTLSSRICCVSAPFAVRCGHVLLSWLWRTPQIIGARKITMSACIHTHTLFLSVPLFPSGLWYFDVPFRFKGHSKLSAISSSLCSRPSSPIFLCLFCPSLSAIAPVYSTWTLEPVYECVHVCTLVLCPLLCLTAFRLFISPSFCILHALPFGCQATNSMFYQTRCSRC